MRGRKALFTVAALASLLCPLLAAQPSAAPLQSEGTTTRVSVASDGTQGNLDSYDPSISADGRYVAFSSGASNLVSGDTNGTADIFVHDRQTGQTTRVSEASDSTQAHDDSGEPSISANGRYVAFSSHASNLVLGDINGVWDIFVHDRQMGQTTRVSVASDGTQGDGDSEVPSISADGRYVAFGSHASNLVPGDINLMTDVFVHDRETGQTTRVSVASDGTQGNGYSWYPSISADGRYVAFSSTSYNFVPGDTFNSNDIFVHDRQMGETTLVSLASDGTQADGHSYLTSISADGRYVAFQSVATNLVPGDTNGVWDIFVHDRQTGQTARVSVASDGTQAEGFSTVPSISADGRYVAFASLAANLVPGDVPGVQDIFVHDRQTGQTTQVSVASDGTQGNWGSGGSCISADGCYVAFTSAASNLVPSDTNGTSDVFVHDREEGPTPTGFDFELYEVSWTPSSPVQMSESTIVVDIQNVGGTYQPATGEYSVGVKLRDTDGAPDDYWEYRILGSDTIPTLEHHGVFSVSIPFYFTRPEADQIEVTFFPTDVDSNPANNLRIEAVTIQPAAHKILSCLSLVLDVVTVYCAAHGISLDVWLTINANFQMTTAKVFAAIAANDLPAAQWHTIKFVASSAATLWADLLVHPYSVAISFVKGVVSAVWDAYDCLGFAGFVANLVKGLVFELNAKGAEINGVIAESPIYVMAINSSNQRAGFLDDGSVVSEIPGAEVLQSSDGEKLILYPGRDTQSVLVTGSGVGDFDLTLAIGKADGSTHHVEYQNVSVSTDTVGTIDATNTAYPLEIDDNGDGTIDRVESPSSISVGWPGMTYLPLIMKNH